ncbi:MAG TPA: hypothetical protein EYH09_00705 [Candidatus Nanopusillus sp.]|nr:hypothetical protein [Candidatus Nanopusillus sp.]
MVKITVTFGKFPSIEFHSEDIEKIEEMDIEGNKSIFVILKDNRKILLPISKEEFEKLLAGGEDINLEFSL